MQRDTQIWQDWLNWLPTAALSDLPAGIFDQYYSKLRGGGNLRNRGR